MILVWSNIKTFQQHLEDMRDFRNSHNDITPEAELRMLKTMPTPADVIVPCEKGLIKSFLDSRGKLILVPIWDVEPPRGSQN